MDITNYMKKDFKPVVSPQIHLEDGELEQEKQKYSKYMGDPDTCNVPILHNFKMSANMLSTAPMILRLAKQKSDNPFQTALEWISTKCSISKEWNELFFENFFTKPIDGYSQFVDIGFPAISLWLAYITKVCTPTSTNIFSFTSLPLKKVTGVILGDGLYSERGVATGRCFESNNKIPVSLRAIMKSLQKFKHMPNGFPDNGNLQKWVDQGILLLNTSLTCEVNAPNSHKINGINPIMWEVIVKRIISVLMKQNVFIICLGKYAQELATEVQNMHQLKTGELIFNVHPKSCFVNDPFFYKDTFGDANRFLAKRYKKEINWNLL